MALQGHLRVVQENGTTLRVTIPKPMAEEMGITANDDIWWEKQHDHLEAYVVEVQPKTGAINPKEGS